MKRTWVTGPHPSVGRATQFKPGRSGNPGGRPTSKPITQAYRAILEREHPEHFAPMTGAEKIALAQYERAVRGAIRHAIEIADRVEGKAGADDGAITIHVRKDQGDWQAAIKKSLTKKKPTKDWPK